MVRPVMLTPSPEDPYGRTSFSPSEAVSARSLICEWVIRDVPLSLRLPSTRYSFDFGGLKEDLGAPFP